MQMHLSKSCLVVPFLIVKLAFIYEDDKRHMDYVKPSVCPTYRISMHVYPKLTRPKVSAALSDITKTGVIKPLFIVKTQL